MGVNPLMQHRVIRCFYHVLLLVSLVYACTEVATVSTQTELEDAITCASTGLTNEIIIDSPISLQYTVLIRNVTNLVILGYDVVNGEDIVWAGAGSSGRLFDISSSSLTFSNLNLRGSPISGSLNIIESSINFYRVQINPEFAASAASTTHGCGIFANMSQIVLNESSVFNWSCERGAGVELLKSELNVFRSNITNNVALLDGGGVYAGNSCQVYIRESEFRSNSAGPGRSGGGLFTEEAVFTLIEDSAFVSNEAAYGSAIFISGSSLSEGILLNMRSTVLSGNAASMIGGIYIDVPSVLSHITCTDNSGYLAGIVRSRLLCLCACLF